MSSTLARRGDVTACERMIQGLRSAGPVWERRILILLDNVAKQSGVPLPKLPPPPAGDDEDYDYDAPRKRYLAWWKKHRRELKLADPWLPLLDARKVD